MAQKPNTKLESDRYGYNDINQTSTNMSSQEPSQLFSHRLEGSKLSNFAGRSLSKDLISLNPVSKQYSQLTTVYDNAVHTEGSPVSIRDARSQIRL